MVCYATRKTSETRGHGVTPEVLANLKRQFAKHPKGTILRRDGTVVALGDGRPNSGKRALKRGQAVATRPTSREATRSARECLKRVDQFLAATPRAAAERKASEIKARIAKLFSYED